jgi:diacylglycerol kinase family enzyme
MYQPVLIVNPFASRVDEQVVRAVEEVLHPVATLRTEGPRHATELARSAEGDGIVVLGGDGAANEVLNGIAGDVPVGVLPGGGTNVLARALGLPRDPVDAARRIAKGRTRRISLGRVNGRRFGFAASVGLDAAAVRRIDARGRSSAGKRPGDVAFAVAVLRTLPRFREPVLEITGVGRGAFALVANADPYTYVGRMGLHVMPHARFEDGLDVIAPQRLQLRRIPRYVRYILLGRGQDRDSEILYRHDLDAVEIVCDRPLPVQADGEDLGDALRIVLEAERDAVSVLC